MPRKIARGKSRRAVSPLLLAVWVVTAAGTSAQGQGITQVACQVAVERVDDRVRAVALAQVSQLTRVDYTLTIVRIGSEGIGAEDISGTSDLISIGETEVLTEAVINAGADGWVEFELVVTERLTANTCEASAVTLPIN